MALVSCLECGNPVSEDAPACSRCGRPPNAGPIQTRSHVPALASIGQRVVARGIDATLVYLAATALTVVLSWVIEVGSNAVGTAVVTVFVATWIVYFTVFEAGGARTPGKAAVGLSVTGGDHVSGITALDAFVRNVVLVIPLLWLVALGGMVVDAVRRQGFHDRLVGTLVVYTG